MAVSYIRIKDDSIPLDFYYLIHPRGTFFVVSIPMEHHFAVLHVFYLEERDFCDSINVIISTDCKGIVYFSLLDDDMVELTMVVAGNEVMFAMFNSTAYGGV